MLVKPDFQPIAKIKVVGVGGGGGNAVNSMIKDDIQGVEFFAVNTDAQALKNSLANTIAIGEDLTRGLGVGGNPEVGTQAAEESVDILHEHLRGADMVFITAGMGGGTGTGAAPTVAKIAKGHGALTVGIVTKPFGFEGKRRMDIAVQGIEDLHAQVDTLIVVPNQRILDIIEEDVPFLEAMKKSDDVLIQAVRSISSLVTQTGFINVDFADVKTVMNEAGTAMMGMGAATGDDRALKATQQAINSPLLEMSIDGATGVLINVIGGKNMSMKEVQRAGDLIHEVVSSDATIIFGATVDEAVEDDELQVTVLATGFDDQPGQAGESYVSSLGETSSSELMTSTNRPAASALSGSAGNISDDSVSSPNSGQTSSSSLGDSGDVSDSTSSDDVNEDDLDIPAFMRRNQK